MALVRAGKIMERPLSEAGPASTISKGTVGRQVLERLTTGDRSRQEA